MATEEGIKTFLKDNEPNSTNVLLDFMQNFMALNWYKNSKNYNMYLFVLWIIFASILYSISFGIKSSQTIFVIYCCNIWLVMLAFLFLLMV
jgi:hypothetical protein